MTAVTGGSPADCASPIAAETKTSKIPATTHVCGPLITGSSRRDGYLIQELALASLSIHQIERYLVCAFRNTELFCEHHGLTGRGILQGLFRDRRAVLVQKFRNDLARKENAEGPSEFLAA